MNYIVKDLSDEIVTFNPELVEKVASDWVHLSAKVKPTDHVLIIYDVGGRQLAKEVARLCSQKGARVYYYVRELEMDSVLFANLKKRDIARYYSFLNSQIMQADVVLMIRAAKDPTVMENVSVDRMKEAQKAQKPIYGDYRVNHTNWQLIYWPTKAEANLEGLPFEEYVKLYFNACDQPWDEIKKAQEILTKILDEGKTLTLIADPSNPDPKKRTHLEVGIEGMTFINSTIDNNYPGSEVFSAPEIDKVDGQFFAAGKRMLGHENKIIEDVYFKVEKGVIVEAKSKTLQEDLDEFLSRDEGARRFGEIAFGTNPGLRRRLFNGLLNEKVGGSFHITPGSSYEFSEHEGKPVKVFNGNVSSIHWDITIQMLPEYGGGEVLLDGKIIQKDGEWIIPGLEILNRGLTK